MLQVLTEIKDDAEALLAKFRAGVDHTEGELVSLVAKIETAIGIHTAATTDNPAPGSTADGAGTATSTTASSTDSGATGSGEAAGGTTTTTEASTGTGAADTGGADPNAGATSEQPAAT